jgi:hypothetical protein
MSKIKIQEEINNSLDQEFKNSISTTDILLIKLLNENKLKNKSIDDLIKMVKNNAD